MGGPASGTFARRNQASLTAIVVGGVYLAIALTAHFVLIGIVPALMAFRAFQRRETLAPLAAIVAVAVIATSAAVIYH